MTEGEFERACAALWAEIDDVDEDEFLARMEALVAELPAGDGIGMFERAAALDSTGHSDRAVPLYQAALKAGLGGERRRRASIQMASSLRNLGQPDEALRLLTEEAARTSDALDGAVATFTALTLADLGREREGLAVSLTALAATLPRYNRSAARYAQALTEPAAD